jgi:hypothetical protein
MDTRRGALASEWIFSHDNSYLRPYTFLDAGILALHAGDVDRAGRLVACARIFVDSDSIPDPDDRVELDDAIAWLRQDLGDQLEAVWSEGTALSLDQAQALSHSRDYIQQNATRFTVDHLSASAASGHR